MDTVWDLLGKVILQSLPLEQIDVESENSFKALLRWKLGFVPMPLNLKGELTDVNAPKAMSCVLQVQKAVMRLSVKVDFSLTPVEGGKSIEVVGTAAQMNEKNIFAWLLRRQMVSFARRTFDAVQKRLLLLCESD